MAHNHYINLWNALGVASLFSTVGLIREDLMAIPEQYRLARPDEETRLLIEDVISDGPGVYYDVYTCLIVFIDGHELKWLYFEAAPEDFGPRLWATATPRPTHTRTTL